MTLKRGDLPPRILVPPPGPRSRQLSADLAECEAPGVNTLYRGEPQILWEEALGANVLDVDGNRFVDFTSGFGVAFIGHRHPRVVAAVAEQSHRLVHGLGDVAAHPGRLELARRLTELVPMDDPLVYFAVSGSDAVEVAVKTALLASKRPDILAFEPSYHGLTLGSLALTSRSEFRAPFASHLHGHVHRLPYGCDIAAVREVLARHPVALVLAEPLVGREGILVPPRGWLAAVAAAARETGALFAVDEVFTGFGKTGELFAVESEGVRPDLLVCGKALGGGLPIAATLGRRHLMAAWQSDGEARHTATFLAHPLAVAAALATLEVLDSERLVERARRLGSLLEARLGAWAQRFPSLIEACRGRGLVQGVAFHQRAEAQQFARAATERGVLLLAGGPEGRVAQLVPPAAISLEVLNLCLDELETVLDHIAASAPRSAP